MSSQFFRADLFRILLISLPALFFALLTTAIAAPARSTRSSAALPKTPAHDAPYALYSSLSIGPASIAEPGLDISGTQFEALLLGELRAQDWRFTAGGGYFRSSLTGRAEPSARNAGLALASYELVTEATALQTGISRRIIDSLEVGFLGQVLLGPDVGFRSGFGNSGVQAAWLGGMQAAYELRPTLGTRMKLGARYLRSLNLAHRMDAVQATLTFGMPVR